MEEKINVAEILKEKPQGTKLYDLLYNIDVELDAISATDTETVVWCTNETDNNTTCHRGYSEFGTVRGCSDGLRILLPSKEMRDWSKFAWKKGDILVNKDAKVHIIFDGFDDDTYKNFHGQYYLWEEGGSIVSFEEDENYMQTSDFNKANKEDAQEYIHKIEKELGGKLNMETLEIEKPQPEFKDGDIVCISGMGYLVYGIVKSIDYSSKKLEYYVLNDMSTLKFEDWLSFEDKQIQPITETQQIILFEALAKENKAWNPETKTLEDLPKRCEFQPMDWCLMRDIRGEECFAWSLCQFAYQLESGKYEAVGGMRFEECIPYNEQTKHLLGTTDEWER